MKKLFQTAHYLGVNKLLALSRATKQKILISFDVLVATSTWNFVVSRIDGEGIVNPFVFVGLVIAIGSVLGLYRAVLRFAGVRVLLVVGISYGVASIFEAFLHILAGELLPLSNYLYLALSGTALAAGGRILVREALFRSATPQKDLVVIYGAGDAGRQLLTAITQSQTMQAVAMIDDDASLAGVEFHGVRVLLPSSLESLCKQYQVHAVILALPTISRSRRAEILQTLEALPVQVRSMPRITDILAGHRDMLDFEAVSIEELLGRDPVAPICGLMQQVVSRRVICVTGAGGSIGSELVHQLVKLLPKKLVLVEISEFALYQIFANIEEEAKFHGVEVVPVLQSVIDTKAMAALFKEHRVQLLFHAAAYKHVPLVEHNPFSGLVNNVFGTKATLDAAIEAKLESVVLISTDKAVRPTNIMGSSKRIAELIAQAYSARHAGSAAQGPVISMVRFGNVLSSSGSVIPRFQEQIRQGGPLTVTHPEITRYFMTIPEAVELVIQTAGLSKGGEVFLLDMGEPVKILDLAVKMIRLSGMKPVFADLWPSSQFSHRPVGRVANSDIENPVRSTVKCASHTQSIQIVFTGLRPGEKLFEELLIDAAAERTEHPMISRANERFTTWEELGPMIETLSEICLQGDQQGLRAILEKFDIGYHKQSESNPVVQPSDARLVEDYRFGGGDTLHVNMQPARASIQRNEVSIVCPSESVENEKTLIHPLLSKSLHLFFLLTRPLTLGARGIVLNEVREVLLVRHRYEQGWQLPGGGVEIGESPIEALRREVLEETGVEILGDPILLGAYHNSDVSVRDHVLVYRCDHYRIAQSKTLSGEIAASGFFPIDHLPKGTTLGTKRRLVECFEGQALSENW